MALVTLLLCTLLESIVLYSLRKHTSILIPIVILLGFLLLILFVLPRFFMPELNEDGINCGMPALAVYFGFWVYGILSTSCVALIFFFTKTRK